MGKSNSHPPHTRLFIWFVMKRSSGFDLDLRSSSERAGPIVPPLFPLCAIVDSCRAEGTTGNYCGPYPPSLGIQNKQRFTTWCFKRLLSGKLSWSGSTESKTRRSFFNPKVFMLVYWRRSCYTKDVDKNVFKELGAFLQGVCRLKTICSTFRF